MTFIWDNSTMRFHEEPITKVWPRLYVGCYWDAQQLKKTNPSEITAVINLTPDPITHKKDMRTFNFPIADGLPVDEVTFWQIMNAIQLVIQDGCKVLVHCHAGQSRSVSMIAAYLYLVGFTETLDEAVQYIKEKRGVITPHHEILKSIKKHLKIWPYSGELGKPTDAR